MAQDAPSSLALVRTSSMGTTTAAPGQSQQQAQHPQQQLADDAINVNALPFLNDWDGSACEAEQVGDWSASCEAWRNKASDGRLEHSMSKSMVLVMDSLPRVKLITPDG